LNETEVKVEDGGRETGETKVEVKVKVEDGRLETEDSTSAST